MTEGQGKRTGLNLRGVLGSRFAEMRLSRVHPPHGPFGNRVSGAAVEPATAP